MEIWDLYDENRKLTGQTHIRGNEIPAECYHLVVHVWIRNREGKYLISQRSANRPTYPLLWECVGGSVVAGEDSLTGAIREAREEVGIDLQPQKGRVVYTKVRNTVDGIRFGDIMDVWLFDYDGEVDLHNATTDEVAQCHWLTRDEILKIYNAGILVPTLEYFFEKVDQ